MAAGKVLLHQDIEGGKAGTEVDASSLGGRLDWYLAEGYVSTAASRKVDQEDDEHRSGRPASVDAQSDPRLPANDSAKTDYERPDLWNESLAPTPDGTTVPESFNPDEHTAEEVKTYLERDDIHDVEKRRVLAAERGGKARKSLVGDE